MTLQGTGSACSWYKQVFVVDREKGLNDLLKAGSKRTFFRMNKKVRFSSEDRQDA
jgi:hypothetical protein